LRAGYGLTGRIYDLEETIRAAHRWTRERDARAEPFLSGMFTHGEVVFAGSETEAAHDREPVAISTGEVLPHYAGGAKVGLGSRPCENSNTRAAVYEFQSVFGIFGHYRPGRAKKFAPDAPFSDNFRVFTRSGSA
jgi:hypothetical protein